MSTYSNSKDNGGGTQRARRSPVIWLTYASLLLIPILYTVTLAQGLVLGDPTEYTLVANVLGIAHPPGYAFFTLLGKLFQTVIPFGTIPWRMHLLAAIGATVAALSVFGTVRVVSPERDSIAALTGALFGAMALATAADVWQHAIHANPHIITAAFLGANLFFLTRWWAGQRKGSSNDGWLYAFAFCAGLGVTHHPLTVFSLPAYALFILVVRPRIWRQGRVVVRMIVAALLGLAVLLYYPIRSPMQPVFGPDDMNTWQGFLDHVLARGLSESLPFFGLGDQAARGLVFWTLTRLQYTLPTLFLSVLGFIWLLRGRQDRRWQLALLYGATLLSLYAFVINLRVQDIMAYLLGPFLVLGLLAGIGVLAFVSVVAQRVRPPVLGLAIAALFLLGPLLQIGRNLPQVSLHAYDEGDAHVADVFAFFEGGGEGAVLLHDWEHMTPMWYTKFVEGRWPDPTDVRPEFVSTDRPWVDSVFAYLPGGPVYVNSYRQEIVGAGFRLRPRGPFYEVVEPGVTSAPPELTPANASAEGIEIVGYELPQETVQAGAYVPLTLAMRAPVTTTQYFVPVLQVGAGPYSLIYEYTTDNHLLTPLWQPDEVIVERFDFALPHDLPGGEFPLTLQMRNLSTNELTELALPLGELRVEAQRSHRETEHLLANFRQRVGLVRAVAWQGLSWRNAPWQDPLQVAPGDTVGLILQWESLAHAEESYTVFVHLIDGANRPVVTLDYTPLGGAAPTHLWIPKWLPGQRLYDPYRLPIPADLADGTYYIEVGLYEMTGGRRLLLSDEGGSNSGDRYILGPVVVDRAN